MTRGISSLPFGVLLLVVAAPELPGAGASLFRERAAELGLKFAHVNGAAGRYHLPEIMGAGGAFLDYDRDGDLDVLLMQGRALEPHAAAPQPPASPRLFRNDLDAARGAASLRFADVSERAGFATGDYGMGVATGDYDNDGDPDVYLTNYGPNRLYRNDGGGRFADVTRAAGAGLNDPRWSTSASFSDYDADGDLDLFLVNYVDFTVAGSKVCSDPVGARDYCGPLQFDQYPTGCFEITETAPSPMSVSRPGSREPTDPVSVWQAPTSTVTAGWTSTSRTTGCPTSFGSISATARL